MILDSYFKFDKFDNRSQTRFDLVCCNNKYEQIYKPNKDGEVWIYLQTNLQHIKTNLKRKACLSVSTRNGHLSSIFIPDPSKPNLGFGDVKGTADALLFIIQDKTIEIFVAKGKKNIGQLLYFQLFDGELDHEMETLRKLAQTIS